MPTQTREAIIQATIELFNEYGPMVPMAKISERAGVAAGTPFRYFPTKDALLHAAYIAAREHTLRLSPQADITNLDSEQTVKSIIYTIMKWSALCPQELEYMRKYEDSVCYDCFSDRFSEELYIGIVREHNLWPRLKDDVRPDLPESFINRVISINCSLYSRYIAHMGFQVDSPEFESFMHASADSIWNSIRRM